MFKKEPRTQLAVLLPMVAAVLGMQCTAFHSTSSYARMAYRDCKFLGSWSWKNISLASLTIAKETSFSSLPLTSKNTTTFHNQRVQHQTLPCGSKAQQMQVQMTEMATLFFLQNGNHQHTAVMVWCTYPD